jgi:phage FluMu protein Com
MGAGKIIAYIAAGIMVIFGFLFILGSGGQGGGGWGWVFIGGILLIAAFALIYLVSRRKPGSETQNVTLNIDLPGNTTMESMKCKSCGGVLSEKDISLVNGAAVVTCPYCKTVYTLTEEPKW